MVLSLRLLQKLRNSPFHLLRWEGNLIPNSETELANVLDGKYRVMWRLKKCSPSLYDYEMYCYDVSKTIMSPIFIFKKGQTIGVFHDIWNTCRSRYDIPLVFISKEMWIHYPKDKGSAGTIHEWTYVVAIDVTKHTPFPRTGDSAFEK